MGTTLKGKQEKRIFRALTFKALPIKTFDSQVYAFTLARGPLLVDIPEVCPLEEFYVCDLFFPLRRARLPSNRGSLADFQSAVKALSVIISRYSTLSYLIKISARSPCVEISIN